MRRAFAIALTTAAIFGQQGSAAPAAESGRSGHLTTRAVAQAGAVGGVVVLANGTTVRRTATGFADTARRDPMTTGARFRIASVTKTFVATVVLQLVGEGRLGLDDSVESLIPGRVIGGDSVTVRQLLGHRSGIYRGGPLVPTPGSFHYDNSNFVILGAVVEAITGTPLPAIIDQRIVKPLGLRGTVWPTSTIPVHVSRGYDPRGIDVTTIAPRSLDASDALVSTADDLHVFLRALLGGRLLAPAELREMLRAQRVSRPYRPIDDRYGLGLMVYGTRCGPVVGHRGRIDGYTTFVFGTAVGRRSAVVMLNVGRIDDARAVRLNQLIFTELCASTPATRR